MLTGIWRGFGPTFHHVWLRPHLSATLCLSHCRLLRAVPYLRPCSCWWTARPFSPVVYYVPAHADKQPDLSHTLCWLNCRDSLDLLCAVNYITSPLMPKRCSLIGLALSCALSCKFPIGHADRNFGPLLCLVPYFTHLSVVLRAVNTPLVMLSATLVLFCASCRISPIDQTGSNFGTNCTHAVLVKM